MFKRHDTQHPSLHIPTWWSGTVDEWFHPMCIIELLDLAAQVVEESDE
jgi:hypothetical protein